MARNSDRLRSFVEKALTDGRILEETETIVEDKRIVMIQSGDAFGEQKIVGYLIKKPTDTSYVLVSFMPKLQGIFFDFLLALKDEDSLLSHGASLVISSMGSCC